MVADLGIEIITLIVFVTLFIFLALGVPVGFALGAVTIIFTIIFWGPKGLSNIPLVVHNQMSPVLLAIPLFLLMANVLERSGIADALYEAIYRWTSAIPGGLAIGTVLICAVYGAMSGVSGAATVSMGIVAIPSMRKRNYSKHLAAGAVAAGGVLGIVIPPSVIMILYASIVQVSVGSMFFGGIIPGIMIAILHGIFIFIRCLRTPSLGPVIPVEERFTFTQKLQSLKLLILPGILIFVVLFSIYAGITTPTEAAAVGAVGAFICAAFNRRLNLEMFKESTRRTLGLSVMIMWIVFGASMFNSLYIAIGGRAFVVNILAGLDLSPWLIVIGMQLALLLLGMIMDDYAVVMLAAPIFSPVVVALGFDPIWFGVLFILNMQIAYLTPPYGFNLFYLKGVVQKDITMGDLYKAVFPFVLVQLLGLILVMVFPFLITWLPSLMLAR